MKSLLLWDRKSFMHLNRYQRDGICCSKVHHFYLSFIAAGARLLLVFCRSPTL